MYRDNKIGLVIPAYNEEKLIVPTLESVPEYVDAIFVVDDCSTDNMASVVAEMADRDSRITVICHDSNQGPGAAIISGYLAASQDDCAVTVVCGGDNQMPLDEMPNLLDPVIDGKGDYAKGNRFMLSRIEDTLKKMPKTRLIGNMIITALTKISSGYYHIMDVVDGYTAISKRAIDAIDWGKTWKRYGYPMDFLVRLNAYGFKVVDVPRTAIYLPGERQSQIKGGSYFMQVSPMLLKDFLWRLKFKYVYLSFHPLVLFYLLAFILFPVGVLDGLHLIWKHFIAARDVTGPQAILCALLIITGLQSFFFAMWFDMEEGR